MDSLHPLGTLCKHPQPAVHKGVAGDKASRKQLDLYHYQRKNHYSVYLIVRFLNDLYVYLALFHPIMS